MDKVVKIGRSKDNDVVIADRFVSSRHAELHVEADGMYLTDVGSKNGTFVNGRSIETGRRVKVAPDDRFSVAYVVCKVLEDGRVEIDRSVRFSEAPQSGIKKTRR